MKRKKFKLDDIKIANIDINLIKDFIDLYEDCTEKFKEYNSICENIMQNQKIKELMEKKELNLDAALNDLVTSTILEMSNCKNESKQKELKKELEKYQHVQTELNKYEKIVKIYNEIYAGNLQKYFNDKEIENKLEEKIRKKYLDYNEEEIQEQIKIEKKEYLKRKACTITRIYINVKYLYEICTKLYKYEPKKKTRNPIILLKTKMQQLSIKRKIEKEYKEKNEINIIKTEGPLFIDMDSLEQNVEFYEMFKDAISSFVIDRSKEIIGAVKESEIQTEEIEIAPNMTILPKKTEEKKQPEKTEYIDIEPKSIKEQIEELKKVKEELTSQEEEQLSPTKSA